MKKLINLNFNMEFILLHDLICSINNQYGYKQAEFSTHDTGSMIILTATTKHEVDAYIIVKNINSRYQLKKVIQNKKDMT